MKYETSRERQEIGFQNFLEVHLKEASLNKNKKSVIKMYIFFVIAIGILFIYPNYRWFAITLTCLVIGIPVFYKIMMSVSKSKAKKTKLPDNIEKIVHVFEYVYEVVTWFKGGSANNVKYEYSEIFKVIESEEFFYVYVNPYSALPLDKQSIDNCEEFISFIKSKNIQFKGLTENED